MSGRLRIALVIHSLRGGGAERVARYLIEQLDRSAFDLRLILYSADDETLDGLGLESPPVSLEKRSRWSFPAMAVRLRRVLRQSQADVVVSFLDVTNVLAVVASRGLERPRVVVNERNFPREHLRRMRFGRFKLWLLQWAYRRADLVVCNSLATGESLAADLGVPAVRVATIHNPVPVDHIRRLATADIRHPYFERGVQVVMGVGRLVRQKRFDLLIRAFAEVRKREAGRVRLVIVGDGPERRSLQALASALGIADSTDLIGHQDNPYSWLQRAAVFVLSSDYEGFPNVVLEAMACGVPVVATDCPSGPNEIITDGIDGILVPAGDSMAMAAAIRDLLGNEERRMRHAAAARRRVEAFGLPSFVASYAEALQRVAPT